MNIAKLKMTAFDGGMDGVVVTVIKTREVEDFIGQRKANSPYLTECRATLSDLQLDG